MKIDATSNFPQKPSHGRRCSCFPARKSETEKTRSSGVLPPSLLRRMRCCLAYCTRVFGGLHSFAALDRVRMGRTNPSKSRGNHPRNERRMACLPDRDDTPAFQANIQIPDQLEGGAVRNKKRSANRSRRRAKDRRLSKAKRALIIMPLAAVEPQKRLSFPYSVPATGKIRITVEASIPVDIYVTRVGDDVHCSSVALAMQHKIYTLPQRMKEDQQLTLPESWRTTNWLLVIGNPSAKIAAINYNVFSA
jgi:hypothetical protein